MYNRFGPQEGFQPLEDAPGDSGGAASGSGSPFSLLRSLLGGAKNAGETGILEKLGLGQLDKGDILLLLVLIYLFRESGDDEWLIILALVLLMGSG